MLKVWLLSFLFIFALAKFVPFILDIFSSLPIYILAGACLAIASNYEKGILPSIRKATGTQQNLEHK
jgi:hypothetical protein